MAQQGARVESIDAIKLFRAALIKFAESGNVALTSADSDVDKTIAWLEREQSSYWATQVRKRHEAVQRCEQAVREKRVFKGFDGREQSAVDEMKALSNARRLREEAEHKTIAVKKAIQVLHRESQLYKGRIQKLATTLQQDIPNAARTLDAMLMQLENYLSIQTSGQGVALSAAAESFAQSAGAAKRGHERLRDLTPSAEQRKAAPARALSAGDSFFQPWATGAIEPWQHEALSKLAIDRQPVDPDHKVIVSRDCWQQPRIYLERRHPAFDDDTGWVIAQTDETQEAPHYQAVRAGDLIAAPADLADLLWLPPGFLVVLDTGGPVAILDVAGLDVWAVALMSTTPPEPAIASVDEDSASSAPAPET